MGGAVCEDGSLFLFCPLLYCHNMAVLLFRFSTSVECYLFLLFFNEVDKGCPMLSLLSSFPHFD
jgi:hypothetical protein